MRILLADKEDLVPPINDYAGALSSHIDNHPVANEGLSGLNDKATGFFKTINWADLREFKKSESLPQTSIILNSTLKTQATKENLKTLSAKTINVNNTRKETETGPKTPAIRNYARKADDINASVNSDIQTDDIARGIEQIKSEILLISGDGYRGTQVLFNYIEKEYKTEPEMLDKLVAIRDFAKLLGEGAADYFGMMGNTKAVEKLTGKEFQEFAKSIKCNAYLYFRAIRETNAVDELTDERVLDSTKFINAMGESIAYSYFSAIGETKEVSELTGNEAQEFARSIKDAAHHYFTVMADTKAVHELTDERVLKSKDFINVINKDVAREYFRAIGKTKAVDELTSKEVQDFAKSIGSVAYHYFREMGKTKAAHELTDKRVLNNTGFIKAVSESIAREYFRAIGETKAVNELTSKEVQEFAKSINDTAYPYFSAIANTKAVHELTDKRVLNNTGFIKAVSESASYNYFSAIGETKAVSELTSKEVQDFVKSITYAASEYFRAIGKTKAVSELTSKEVQEFAKSINDIAHNYFGTIAETMAVHELTDERVLNSAEFINAMRGSTSREYFRAIGKTKALKELTSKEVQEFAKSINDIASNYFIAIGRTKAVHELTDERVLNSAGFINTMREDTINEHYSVTAHEYFVAIGKTKEVKKLTSKEVQEFAKSIGSHAIYMYFRVMANAKAVGELNDERLLGNSALMRLMSNYSSIWSSRDVHYWYFNAVRVFGNEFIEKQLNLDSIKDKEWLSLKSNDIKLLGELAQNLDRAIVNDFGTIDTEFKESLAKMIERTGGSVAYLAMASNFITSEEDFGVFSSMERSKVDKLILNGIKEYFGVSNALNLEDYGGIGTLRLIWDNKELLKNHKDIISHPADFAKFISEKKKEEFGYIKGILPFFNEQKTFFYNLVSDEEVKEFPKEKFDEVAKDCDEILDALFYENGREISINEQFDAISENVGKGMKRRLKYIWNKYELDKSQDLDALVGFAKELKAMEKDIIQIKPADSAKYAKVIYAEGQIINFIEAEFSKRYFNEQLLGKNAADVLSANEILGLAYQYTFDPDFHVVASKGRQMLFDYYKGVIERDSKMIGEAIPNGGILTVKTWNRSISDIFGGRYSGDCTAPHNTGEYSGMHFDWNLKWINDPGTMMMNVYWQNSIEENPAPVGRIYCFAVETDRKPAIMIDSIEFLASFGAGEKVKDSVIRLMHDMSDYFNAEVVIDANSYKNSYKISNRDWVNGTVRNAGLETKRIRVKKLGDQDSPADHISAYNPEMSVFYIERNGK